MPEPVIPSMQAEDTAEPSAAVLAQREVVAKAHTIFTLVAAQRIAINLQEAVAECAKAVDLLKYADSIYAAECKKLDDIIASEMLGKEVSVTNGSVISLKPAGMATAPRDVVEEMVASGKINPEVSH